MNIPTPQTPVQMPPAPQPVPPPPTLPGRSAKIWGIVLVVGVFVLAVGVFAYRAGYLPVNYGTVPQSTTSPEPSKDGSTVPGVETFLSNNLGIRFEYLVSQGSPVIEKGDTVYVGGTQGQWVRVFSKQTADDLKTAITKKFLSGVPAGKCIVQITAAPGSPNITTGSITFDFTPSDPGDPRIAASPCPAEYRATNGIRYFWMDTDHPDRFFFFSIGQYAIMAEPGTGDGLKTWQDTFRVFDPSPTVLPPVSEWKTYSNTQYGFEFTYPGVWPTPSPMIADSTLWAFGVGPVIVGGCEGVDCPTYTMAAVDTTTWNYDRVLADVRSRLAPAGLVYDLSTETINGNKTILYNEGGMCGFGNGFMFVGSRAIRIVGHCAEVSDTMRQLFASFKFEK